MNKTGIFINKKFKLAIVGCVVFLLMIGVTGTLLTRKGPNDLNTAGNTNTNIANEAHMTYDGQWMYYTEDNGREEEGV